jgi:dTDP-4-amino-4,6-dideoxygalactose transaminase
MKGNAALDYSAYAAALLNFHKLSDDIADEKGMKKFVARLLRPMVKGAAKKARRKGFEELENKGFVTRPFIPEECKHNAHMFYLKAESLETRTKLISFLKENSVLAVFHYVPLHSAPAGQRFGEFVGEDKYTTAESDRLLRLPMYYGLTDKEVEYVIEKVYEFYKG